jgi:hypothetical protein
VSDTPPEAAPISEAKPPPLGEKTTSVIFSLLLDLYRQEFGAEEDVHRTLPFFASLSGILCVRHI